MKLGRAIEAVARAEAELAGALERVGERHRTDHELFHVTAALAPLARARIERLAALAERFGASVEPGGTERGGPLTTAREKLSEALGSRSAAGLLLLRDLRELYLLACAASIDWTVLGQGAQAAKSRELLDLVADCHAEELRVREGVTTQLKEAAPQVLTS